MTERYETLSELIPIARDGQVLYERAAEAVDDPSLAAALQRMATTRQTLINEMAGFLETAKVQAPEDAGTLRGTLHQWYADLKARWATNPADAYLPELVIEENRLLARMEALQRTADPEIEQKLESYLPRVRSGRDRIERLDSVTRRVRRRRSQRVEERAG